MSGNSNINWIGGNVDTYITVRVEDENVTNFYFTASFLDYINEHNNNFLDLAQNNHCNIMIGFDKDENCLLFALTKEPNVYSSAFTLHKDDKGFKGKPKKITNETLYSFIRESSDKTKFKLVDNDVIYQQEEDRILIKSYMNDVLYY